MAKIIAVANQKGGVGKTTTSVNLAASLVAVKRRILLIDLDPQGNATTGSGVEKNLIEFTAYDALREIELISSVIVPTISGYDLIPSNGDLTAAEVMLLGFEQKEFRLKKCLDRVLKNYDYILIDCPPSLNMLTVNALCAASSVIIPMQCEYFALEGLAALIGTIERLRKTANPTLRIEGLIRTMFDPRNSLSNEVSNQLLATLPEKVYRTIIPRNVRLAEAPSHGLPVLKYDKTSKGAIAYLAMAGEMLRRMEHKQIEPLMECSYE